jgi:hypothetical protein
VLVVLADAISQCAFEPGRLDGVPVEVFIDLPLKFQ